MSKITRVLSNWMTFRVEYVTIHIVRFREKQCFAYRITQLITNVRLNSYFRVILADHREEMRGATVRP